MVKVGPKLRSGYDCSILGQYVGKGIPVLDGIESPPRIDQYINLCAMMNVTGAIPMFYIPGFTVGAKTVKEALGEDTPKDTIGVGEEELRRTEQDLFPTGKASSAVQMDGLRRLMLNNSIPNAMVVTDVEPVLVSAAALLKISLVDESEQVPFEIIKTGDHLRVDGTNGLVTVTKLN